jgi:S1-C subfamily serine protease
MRRPSSAWPWACAVGLVLVACPPARAQDTRKEAGLYQRLLKSSVWVVLPASSRPGLLVYDEGSGWVLDVKGKLVVTNYHVVGKKKEVQVFFPRFLGNRLVTAPAEYAPQIARLEGVPGKVIATDGKRDLAVIRLAYMPTTAAALPVAADAASAEERVYSVGNPGGKLWGFFPSTVLAVAPVKAVSKKGGLELHLDMRMVETDDPGARAGQSGSLLANRRGELVGVLQGASRKDPRTTLFIEKDELLRFLEENKIKVNAAAPARKADPAPQESRLLPAEIHQTHVQPA